MKALHGKPLRMASRVVGQCVTVAAVVVGQIALVLLVVGLVCIFVWGRGPEEES